MYACMHVCVDVCIFFAGASGGFARMKRIKKLQHLYTIGIFMYVTCIHTYQYVYIHVYDYMYNYMNI